MVRRSLRALCLCAALTALPTHACERSLSPAPPTSAPPVEKSFGRPRCISREELVEMRRRDGLPPPEAREPDPPSGGAGIGPGKTLPVFLRPDPAAGI